MPKPSQRTRTRKRANISLPGGGTAMHYKQEGRHSKLCHLCGQKLAGVPHLSTSESRKLNRSKKRVWRPYGGELCHNCLKKALKQAARTT